MTMLKSGKMNEIADEMLKNTIANNSLTRTKMGVGQINVTKYTLYYSCNPEKTGQLETGFVIQNEIKKNRLSFGPYNERLCRLLIKGRFKDLSLSVHNPVEEKTGEEKEGFSEDLQIVHNKIPKHDIVIILGDLNAKMLQVNIHSVRSQTEMVSGSVSTQSQTT